MKTPSIHALLFGLMFSQIAIASDIDTAKQEVMKVMDEFMTTFNSRDVAAWEGTFNFPHVRIASNQVKVLEKPGEQPAELFENLQKAGWHHSAWKERKIVQVEPGKAHIAVQFVRYKENNEILATYQSFYIVTLKDGHWGVQARSSFAP
ncbi:MAG: hypothetical protein AAF512_26085 [Pseudomonadota bacterium]